MSIIKCKMCGGELKILPNSTICECEYCGSKQTIPNTDDVKRLKLYERANKLRFENEFDKAAGVYESIVAEYQSEAEAYWGLVLCKYGIEYVDDPKTSKKIPTCHRSSFDSVMDDSNFDLVMENSDTVARGIYREEAKQIEELRKGIVEVSSKEEPYDIFICYKETADDGQRTLDSVIAQDVYQELTDKGYRVFFSRITLEDKLGQEYEPYIFAALNSAKVMLAFGTCYDYYNAVWVKNEWSRFLQLMEAGQKKTLIPCFKDIDAYDMPKEFARLQAQDMGKVGAIQDLIRGIDKIFGNDKKIPNNYVSGVSASDNNSIVRRGYFSLEDGEWDKAIQFFDQAMNSDAENAEIHLGLFLAKRKCSNLDMYLNGQLNQLVAVSKKSLLACKPKDDVVSRVVNENTVNGYLNAKDIENRFIYKLTFDSIVEGLEREKEVYSDKDWVKAERYAKGELRKNILSMKEKHIDFIDRKINEEQEKDAANRDRIIKEYDLFLENAEKEVKNQRFQAEANREAYYQHLCGLVENANTEGECQELINEFAKLDGYKDSNQMIAGCNARIESIRNVEQMQREADKAVLKKKLKRTAIIASIAVVFLAAGITGFAIYRNKVMIPNQKYADACALMDQEKYDKAIMAFEKLDGYKDSNEKIATIKSLQEEAEEEKRQAEYDEKYQSIIDLVDADDYEDAAKEVKELQYEDNKTPIVDYMVDKILADMDRYNDADKQMTNHEIAENAKYVYELANAEQKELLVDSNDDMWINDALNNELLSYINSRERHNFEGYTDNVLGDQYKDDINTINEYCEVFLGAMKNKDKRDSLKFFKVVNYDKTEHCIYSTAEGEDYYVITGDKDYIIIGTSTDEGTYRLKSSGELEKLAEPLKQQAKTFFEGYGE